MAAGFKVKFDDNVRKFARDFVKELGPVMTMSMLQAGNQVVTQLADTIQTTLNKNSKGTLKQSWKVSPVVGSGNSLRVLVSSPLPYARIHQTGGVIRPKRVKALAIPNRSYSRIIRNGVPIAPREFDPGRTKLKFFPPVTTSPGRLRGYLVDKNSGDLAYTLMANVTIKKTNYMTIAVDNALPEIQRLFEDNIKAAMEASERGLL